MAVPGVISAGVSPDENGHPEIIIRGLRNCGDDMCIYEIRKKAKYKILLPERQDPVLAPNVKCIAAVLQESGRDFSVDDVYNFFSSTRTPRNYNHRRLKGAQIIKL